LHMVLKSNSGPPDSGAGSTEIDELN
jgi:hypothetical protein